MGRKKLQGVNCEGVTRRDSLVLGLSGLVAGGFCGALASDFRRGSLAYRGWTPTSRRLHLDLDGRRP